MTTSPELIEVTICGIRTTMLRAAYDCTLALASCRRRWREGNLHFYPQLEPQQGHYHELDCGCQLCEQWNRYEKLSELSRQAREQWEQSHETTGSPAHRAQPG